MKIEYLNEIWKDIKGYAGLYQVSNFGRVRSLPRMGTKGGLLKLLLSGGYLAVNLYKNGKMKAMLVHRLVAIAFIPNPHNYSEVNHKNEIKTDNRVENLEWCTRLYNNTYGTRIERVVSKNLNQKSTSKPVNFTIDGIIIKTFPSQKEAARYFNICNGWVSKICKGVRHLNNGFSFNYTE